MVIWKPTYKKMVVGLPGIIYTSWCERKGAKNIFLVPEHPELQYRERFGASQRFRSGHLTVDGSEILHQLRDR